jgi:hypothetical protein
MVGQAAPMPDVPDIRRVISRILLAVFALALLAGVGGFYVLLYDQAMHTAEQEARIMLASANAVADYTETHIMPELVEMPSHEFYREMVPFFASQTVFRAVSGDVQFYTFRNPTLNPTNLDDRPEPFDIEVTRRFRDDQTLNELTGVRDTGDHKLFFLARPIRVAAPCLTCHSTPDRAPAGMVARYGPNNGFGWLLNDTVGIQMLTVPLTQPLRGMTRLVAILGAGLLTVFAIAYLALSAALDAMVARPLADLARAADEQSLTVAPGPRLPSSGVREIRLLGAAIERLRTSLAKALVALSGEAGADGGRP